MHSQLKRRTSTETHFDPVSVEGAVASVSGLGVVIEDRLGALDIGGRVAVSRGDASGEVIAEVVGLKEGTALCLPFGTLEGVKRGARARFMKGPAAVYPGPSFLGRIIGGLGGAADGGPAPAPGPIGKALRASPPPAARRQRLGPPVDFGVKALNAFAPARSGQRLGIFSGSGVGKSSLLSMIARNADFDVNVIALIGERGREVREFVEDNLGPEGLAKSVVVVATSDEPAMMRREAAFLAMSFAEHFRDQGARVLCLVDSLTRIAAAQREIGLAAGEPPTARGYTPTVFSLLPALLERSGPGLDDGLSGSVTGVFSVLVEGDDHDEPVADAARSVLDGHIVLDRRIAESGRYPAVDILRTVSRGASLALTGENAALAAKAREHLAVYDDMREMIRIGAYRLGANAEVDRAIEIRNRLETFLGQKESERVGVDETFAALAAVLDEDRL